MAPVDAGRGGQDEPAYAELPAQFQVIEVSQDIGLVAGAGILDAGTDSGSGCQVNDRVNRVCLRGFVKNRE